jgi:hypothetical protein
LSWIANGEGLAIAIIAVKGAVSVIVRKIVAEGFSGGETFGGIGALGAVGTVKESVAVVINAVVTVFDALGQCGINGATAGSGLGAVFIGAVDGAIGVVVEVIEAIFRLPAGKEEECGTTQEKAV